MKLLYILAFLAILLFVSGQGCEQKECSIDTDCARVQITCCSCTTGGTEECVSKNLAPLFQKELEKCPEPEDLLCTNINNCKLGDCLCDSGKCKID